ncbi:Outer membrane usher protein HtrE [Burkholderia glumae]|nr:Outer membrane usher protein HtrE [Burkholderia glumae]QTP35230.1 Outer membrane usher protein HtrE [Burkholderia glumae]
MGSPMSGRRIHLRRTDSRRREEALCRSPLARAAVLAFGCCVWHPDAIAAGCSSDGSGSGDCAASAAFRSPGAPESAGETSSPGARAARGIEPPAAIKYAATADKPGQVAQAVQFNPKFFTGDVTDLSRFTHGNPVAPGSYPVDLSVNGNSRGRYEVLFQAVPNSDVAAPCFTLSDFDRMGVNTDRLIERLEAAGRKGLDTSAAASMCIPFSKALPGGTALFNTADLKLDLTVPQVDMLNQASGYVDPSRWDSGIDAGFVQYNVASYTSHQSGTGSDLSSVYLGLRTGLNVKGWRLRQWSNANWQNRGAGSHWQSVALFAQHDLTALKSQLTIGDSSTSGDVFDSFDLRGIQIASDDRMLPDSVRFYAPVVRGVAETNARVTVRQNRTILTETSVPPGPFALSDLPATGYGGDLEVTIMESDGRQRSFRVPFASVPQLLRPGISRFSIATGMYRDQVLDIHPWVAQAVFQRGLSNLITAYAGAQFSEGYRSGLLGIAFNTRIGAFALDLTMARVELPGRLDGGTGYSTRISYSKVVPGARTNLSIAAYRYSSSRFYSLRDAIDARHQMSGGERLYGYRARSRVQVNINQPLGSVSSLYISGSSQNYWGGNHGYDLDYQVGFSSTFRNIGYSLYAQRSRLEDARISTQVGLNLTIPLGRADSTRHRPFDYLTSSLTRSSGGNNTMQLAASGNSSDAAQSLSYGIDASRVVNDGDRIVGIGGNATYRAPFGTYNVNASFGNQTRQAALTVDGAVVMHSGGITLSPPLGQAFALVEAKGAKGGRLVNGLGARIDGNGYAVVTSLMPYRVNTVALDSRDVPLEVELANTSAEVVPRAESLVKVKIATKLGRPIFADVEDEQGKAMPMGTELFDHSGKSVGIVGQGGLAYLRGLEGRGELRVRWGRRDDEQCVTRYAMPDDDKVVGDSKGGSHAIVARIKLSCDPSLVWASPSRSETRSVTTTGVSQ